MRAQLMARAAAAGPAPAQMAAQMAPVFAAPAPAAPALGPVPPVPAVAAADATRARAAAAVPSMEAERLAAAPTAAPTVAPAPARAIDVLAGVAGDSDGKAAATECRADADASDSDGEEIVGTTLTAAELAKKRWSDALAAGDVIEIGSDDDDTPLAPDAATQARLDAAAAQKAAKVEATARKRAQPGDDAATAARIASYVRKARMYQSDALKEHCQAMGLKVGGTKQERIARLCAASIYGVIEKPRASDHTRQQVARLGDRMNAIYDAHIRYDRPFAAVVFP